MPPLEPCEPFVIGAQPRIGIKVGASNKRNWTAFRGQRNRGDGIDRFPIWVRVVFAYAYDPVPWLINYEVGVSHVTRSSQRNWRRPPGLVVQPVVREIREIDIAIACDVGSASVFMHSGARVKSGWSHLFSSAVRRHSDDYVPPSLRRTALNPVCVEPRHSKIAQAVAGGYNKIRCDW